jgi:hypothetical protein
MNFHSADSTSLGFFLLIVFFVFISYPLAFYRAKKKSSKHLLLMTGGMTLWLIITSLIVLSGKLQDNHILIIPFFASMNICALIFGLSPAGKALSTIPLIFLVGFQAFRLPLELILHSWAGQGTIPETMTWTGQNFDVVTGALALVLCPFVKKSKELAWVFNIVGFILLLNVGRVAIFSSPLPFAWPVQPPLQLIFHLPYAWIGSICVAGAFAGHVILTRALLKK